MKPLFMVAFLVLLFFIGGYCLLFPKNVQGIATRVIEMGITANNPLLREFISSRSYIVSVRLFGVAAYLMFFVLVIGL